MAALLKLRRRRLSDRTPPIISVTAWLASVPIDGGKSDVERLFRPKIEKSGAGGCIGVNCQFANFNSSPDINDKRRVGGLRVNSQNQVHLVDFAVQRAEIAPDVFAVSARVFIRAGPRQTVISTGQIDESHQIKRSGRELFAG